jgi:uncharacterized protein
MKVKRRVATIELAGARVPSIMLLPELRAPVPAVLLLHGYSSSKERLAETMGRSLAARGIASLAVDLPLHGTRDDAMVARHAEIPPVFSSTGRWLSPRRGMQLHGW